MTIPQSIVSALDELSPVEKDAAVLVMFNMAAKEVVTTLKQTSATLKKVVELNDIHRIKDVSIDEVHKAKEFCEATLAKFMECLK
jgi:hypothetical protein